MKFVISLLVLLVVWKSNCEETKAKFPPYIKICKRDSKAFECIKENIMTCKPFLDKGIPRLMIPPMHPFSLPSLDIIGNNLAIKLKNLKVTNLPSLELVGGSINFDDFQLELHLHIPYLYNEFNYEAKGKILVLNFNGKGTGNVNSSDIDINVIAKGHPEKKSNGEFIKIDDINVEYKSKAGIFHLDNLFENQVELNEQTNKLINDNFREFEDEISPDIAKSIAELLRAIATNLFSKFRYDELFPLN